MTNTAPCCDVIHVCDDSALSSLFTTQTTAPSARVDLIANSYSQAASLEAVATKDITRAVDANGHIDQLEAWFRDWDDRAQRGQSAAAPKPFRRYYEPGFKGNKLTWETFQKSVHYEVLSHFVKY